MIYTTLNKIRERNPCTSGWKKLLTYLGKTEADDEPLAMLNILESNGICDAIWCLRACDGIDSEARLYAVACARRVKHLMKDQRSIHALGVAERFANGQATAEELMVARAAADAAADAALAAAALAAADAAADAAARAAAWVAARSSAAAADAALAAADAAARAAADAAAWAAWDDEIKWQEAEFRRVFCS